MSNEFRNFAKTTSVGEPMNVKAPELKEPVEIIGPISVVEERAEDVIEELQSEITANVTEIEPVVEEANEEILVEEPVLVPTLKGKVVNCRLLNVRVKPNKNAGSIGIIPLDSVVTIVEDSINDWYGVITEDGVVGYCMKEFIAVIQMKR